MSSPWSIKGIPQEARAAAKAAAHRQGMTLGAWIVSKIEEEGSAPLAGPSDAAQAIPSRPAPRQTMAPDANAAALQTIAQIFGHQRAEMENQVVATLSARLDALAKVTESLSSTVAQCVQTVEQSHANAQKAEAMAQSAMENADAARGEAAISMRSSAAVAEKAIAALGGVEEAGEDWRAQLQAALEERVERIEHRISESEDEGARQMDALSETVLRTEQMLESITMRLGALQDGPVNERLSMQPDDPSFEHETGVEVEFTQPADAADEEMREIDGDAGASHVAPIDAPGLRERIRTRMKASEFVDENLQKAEAPSYYSPVEKMDLEAEAPPAPALRPDSAEHTADNGQDKSASKPRGGFGLGSIFGMRPVNDGADAKEEEPEFSLEEIPHTQELSPAQESSASASMQNAAPAYATTEDQDRREPVFDLVEDMQTEFDREVQRAADEEDPSELSDQIDLAQTEPEHDEDFNEAIERARRERELLKAQMEAEETAFTSPSDSLSATEQEPLTLGPSEELPPASLATQGAADFEGSNGEPRFWGHIDEDDEDAAAASRRDNGSGQPPQSMAEAVGGAQRSVISSELWPFEADGRLEETSESALRDESGSVRYGVALTLALMGVTAGAAMAALYQLGA